ncbi:hypothetical protein M422DRAFT_247396 [Sphaerobolus stellatus SS14]|nr:hypothetical protein M422DRAFT_247396 [Sphaerobolus stellatus SS14]
MIAAGEAVPGIGGFMKVAGGIFITLIEPVQQMGKNKEDCKKLITNIARLLQTINEELKTLSAENVTIGNSSNAWSSFERRLSIIEEREEDMYEDVVVLRCWSEGDADNSKSMTELQVEENLKFDFSMAGEDIKRWSFSLARAGRT